MNGRAEPSTVAALLRRAGSEISRLMRLELESAKQEMAVKLRSLGIGSAVVAIALVLIVLAIVALVISAIEAVSLVLPPWLAALSVALALFVFAGLLIFVGVRVIARAVPPFPSATLYRLKEDLEWAKTRATSAKI